mmetsp:Transcript_34730/g.94042  ORF Transcript_34730/g.94042 Transcript_34730/m.94042 type:complete len:281 (-) Transcript_34730:4058-4900(-)
MDAGDAGALIEDWLCQGQEHLTFVQFSDHVAGLDVLLVSHGHRGGTIVILVILLCKLNPLLVFDGDPAHCSVLDRLAAHPQARRECIFSRPLDELQHLLDSKGPDDPIALSLEVLLQGNLLGAGKVGLCHVCQEGRALVALHGDPALRAVGQRPTTDARDLLLHHGALQHLYDLVDLKTPHNLCGGHVDAFGDGYCLHYSEVLLHEGKELPLPNSIRLDVSGDEERLLGLEGKALKGLQVLAEGMLGDPLLAGLQQIRKEHLIGQPSLLRLLAECRRDPA